MVKILMYRTAVHYNMTWTVSLQLQVPVEFSREVSNPLILFLRSIPMIQTFKSSKNTYFEKQ